MRNLWTLPVVVALASFAVATGPAKAKRVTITVSRVAQIDNLDKFDVKPDRADFYAVITVDGVTKRTKNYSTDDGHPYWKVTLPASRNIAHITIRLMDDDGGLEEKDDHVDINLTSGKKDLDLDYNLTTGKISGDMSGRRGRVIHAGGLGDNDKGQVWFTIR